MTRGQFMKNFNTEYHWLILHNRPLLDRLLPIRSKSLIRCKEIALLYYNRNSWAKSENKDHKRAYQRASKMGWIDECCFHMKEQRGLCRRRAILRSDGIKFKSITEAAKATDTVRTNISKVLRNKRAKAGGYGWSYCE